MLDTNVIIDAVAERQPFDVTAKNILRLFAAQSFNCAITASTASDIYYITNKYIKDNDEVISKLKWLFTVLDIASVDKADCINAFDTGIVDYEDSLLTICAKKWKANYIITRNIKDFTNSSIPALTPDDFLGRWKAN
ncbi:DNA-binding protein [Spirochaetia bacterium]|nr:DNA-binding protein [Spirochaetia bacterium]